VNQTRDFGRNSACLPVALSAGRRLAVVEVKVDPPPKRQSTIHCRAIDRSAKIEKYFDFDFGYFKVYLLKWQVPIDRFSDYRKLF